MDKIDGSDAGNAQVLYVTKTSLVTGGGGGEKRAEEVLSGLTERGHDATVVCGKTERGLDTWEEKSGYRVRHVTCVPEFLLGEGRLGFLLPRYLFAFCSIPVLVALLWHEEFDVIVENMTPYPTLAVVLAKLFGVPIVAVQHEFHGSDCVEMYDPLTGRIQLLVQNILRVFEYDTIVVPAGYTKRKLEEYGVATEEVQVIPNGINYEAYHQADVETVPGQFVTVGRLCKRKGHDDLLRGFARLHERHPDTQLDIVGKGPRGPELEELATELGVRDAVTFHGFVSHDEKVRLLNRAEAFVFASRQEGFGLVLLEAMAAGLPVVARRLPVYGTFFSDGRHGRLLDEFEAEFPEATEAVLSEDGDEIGARNRSTASEFGWDRTAEGMSDVTDALASNDAYKIQVTVQVES